MQPQLLRSLLLYMSNIYDTLNVKIGGSIRTKIYENLAQATVILIQKKQLLLPNGKTVSERIQICYASSVSQFLTTLKI